MATIYYDFSAGTNGAGTPASPRNTWANPSNGDVIRLKRGTTWTRATQLNLSTFTGLTFEAYANADGSDDTSLPKPIITHTAASTFAWNFQGGGIHYIRDLRFLNCSTNTFGGVLGSGLVAATGVHAQLDIKRCDFEGIAHNAIRLSGTGSAAAPTFRCTECTFSNIGEDAVYGGAVSYEFAYNDVENVSSSTETGDGVGFIDATPTFAWIHHNRIDHSSRPFKHCIIVDVPTAGTGYAVIEDNVLIGSIGNGADNTTVINMESAGIIRRNQIYSGRVAINLAGAGSKATNNLIVCQETVSGATVVALQAANCEVLNNTIVGDGTDNAPLIASAASQTGQVIRNNAAINAGTFYNRGSGATESMSNNAFQNVTTKYTAGSSSRDVDGNLMLSGEYIPMRGSPLLSNGADLGYVEDLRGIKGRQFIGCYTLKVGGAPSAFVQARLALYRQQQEEALRKALEDAEDSEDMDS